MIQNERYLAANRAALDKHYAASQAVLKRHAEAVNAAWTKNQVLLEMPAETTAELARLKAECDSEQEAALALLG